MADILPLSPSPSSPAGRLSRFLATFPSLVEDKIRYAFDILDVVDLLGLIQFWSPVKTDGRWLLTTSNQPFALAATDEDLHKYRLCSVKYRYNVDVNNLEVENDPTIISTGSPATAFLNGMPELLPDLEVAHRGDPLVCAALECRLSRSIVLPVFDPPQNCCVGVVECCSTFYHELVHIFDDLSSALEKAGLKMFDARERLPYKTICGLKHAKDEIDGALKFIWQTIHLDFAQVWIAYKDEDHVAFSSSMEDNQTKRKLGFKLTDRYDDSYDDYYVPEPFEGYNYYVSERFEGYSNICYMLPLKMGERLAGKTLQNYEPHFLKKVSTLSDNEPLMLLRCNAFEGLPFECSCFVICLSSTEASDFEYVFEFLWHEGPNYVKLLESLLFSLKWCLPNFKYASGAKLGDELRIIDVEYPTESEVRSFTIFQGNKSSSASKALGKRRRVVKECLPHLEEKCKTTPIPLSQADMIKAAKNLNGFLSTMKRKCKDLDIEWQGKDHLKRNVNYFYKNQSEKNDEDKAALQNPLANNTDMYLDESTLTIKAECADDMIKFTFPISSATFAAIVEEIGKRFKLDPANFRLKYLDEDGDWILLTSDEDMKVCMKEWRNLSSIVRLRLLPQLSDPYFQTSGA